MIVPLCAQSVSAADSTPDGGISEESIRISESQMVSPTNDSLDLEFFESGMAVDNGISPCLTPTDRDMGVGIRKIRIYPAYAVKGTAAPMYYERDIFIQTSYTNYSQFQGVELSKNDTFALMQALANKIVAAGYEDTYDLIGWYLEGDIEFHFKNPQYFEYQCRGTGIDAAQSPYTKETIYAYETQTFRSGYYYPASVDLFNDYYFVGISGGCYYISSSGKLLGELVQYSVSFNH